MFTSSVCRRLRTYQSGQLQEESGSRWRRSADRHSGHRGAGGLRSHPRQLLPERRGLSARVLHHRARVLHSHGRVQVRVPAFPCPGRRRGSAGAELVIRKNLSKELPGTLNLGTLLSTVCYDLFGLLCFIIISKYQLSSDSVVPERDKATPYIQEPAVCFHINPERQCLIRVKYLFYNFARKVVSLLCFEAYGQQSEGCESE